MDELLAEIIITVAIVACAAVGFGSLYLVWCFLNMLHGGDDE